ncbi:MAG: hypothetical protein H7A23_14190 [Leptospiraceae bacterium]|nr:hypothetical protein [Leptospiraceae bacterium]MCP5495700.1 hypothetical protein [Leptospiraceae bacterium]
MGLAILNSKDCTPNTNPDINLSSCSFFPSNNIWNTSVDTLPVHSNSTSYINSIGSSRGLFPDFGSGLWEGKPIGIPFVAVDGAQEKTNVSFEYSSESDSGPYPIPNNPPIEGGPCSSGDRHILIVDRENCKLYELYSAYPNSDGSYRAGSGAIFDLNSNTLRTEGWTSADAAGLPILPGLVRYEEIKSGSINHAIRFTVSKSQKSYLWPARHYASSSTDTTLPPMGLRLRLKSSFDISSYSNTNQTILTALKKYGLIVADNGSNWYLSGAPNDGWDNDDLKALRNVTGNDFEAVDATSLIVSQDSGEAK